MNALDSRLRGNDGKFRDDGDGWCGSVGGHWIFRAMDLAETSRGTAAPTGSAVFQWKPSIYDGSLFSRRFFQYVTGWRFQFQCLAIGTDHGDSDVIILLCGEQDR